MILTGYLINVVSRDVTSDDGRARTVYNAYIVDNDDSGTEQPLKVSLTRQQAELFRQSLRQEITISIVARPWSYQGQRGVRYEYRPAAQDQQ